MNIKRILAMIPVLALCFFSCPVAYAGTLNPATGDEAAQYLPIVIGVAVVALIVIIIMLITSKKK